MKGARRGCRQRSRWNRPSLSRSQPPCRRAAGRRSRRRSGDGDWRGPSTSIYTHSSCARLRRPSPPPAKERYAQHFKRTRRGSRSCPKAPGRPRRGAPAPRARPGRAWRQSHSSLPGRPRGSKSSAAASKAPSAATPGPRKRRKRRGGTRADQTVKLIEKSPGIGASEIAKTMKIKPNYLYRVLGDLEKEGRVKKKGRQYYPGG